MSEPQPTDEDGELILPPDDVEDDEPEAMTGSAAPDPVAEVLEDDDEPDTEPEAGETFDGPGFPITIALDAEGNGSTHVGVFAESIASVEIDDVDPECIFAGDAAVGVAIIEVRGASTRSKPVSGIVITR